MRTGENHRNVTITNVYITTNKFPKSKFMLNMLIKETKGMSAYIEETTPFC